MYSGVCTILLLSFQQTGNLFCRSDQQLKETWIKFSRLRIFSSDVLLQLWALQGILLWLSCTVHRTAGGESTAGAVEKEDWTEASWIHEKLSMQHARTQIAWGHNLSRNTTLQTRIRRRKRMKNPFEKFWRRFWMAFVHCSDLPEFVLSNCPVWRQHQRLKHQATKGEEACWFNSLISCS